MAHGAILAVLIASYVASQSQSLEMFLSALPFPIATSILGIAAIKWSRDNLQRLQTPPNE